MILRHIFAFAIFSTLLWPQDSRRAQSPLTREEVCQTVTTELRQNGLLESQLPRPDDIEMPITLSAPPARTLRVASACWDTNRNRAQFRLECPQPGQCLPFLVYVRMNRAALDPVLATANNRIAEGSCQSTQHSSPRAAPQHNVVRPGDHAAVVFRGTRLRLSSAVTCLERGAEGDIIRVRNQDGHVFRARISGPGTLEVVGE